jgi:hypothetical protein
VYSTVGIEHDVLWFKVAMNNPLCMRRPQSRAQLAGDFDPPVLRDSPDLLQKRRQILPIDKLHGEELFTIDLTDVVNSANVGVRYLTGHSYFITKELEAIGVVGKTVWQELEGDRLFEFEIVSAIDFSHTASPQSSDDAVSPRENSPGTEPGVGVDVRRGSGQIGRRQR